MLKTCSKCKEEKPVEEFYANSKMGSGYLSACKVCVLAKQKAYAAKHKNKIKQRQKAYYDASEEKRRAYQLRKYFGLTIEQYDKILSDQGGGCGICGKTPEQEGRRLAVDHNHSTKEVRGILCTFCNHFIVNRHTEGRLLRLAADYLDKSGTGFYAPITRKKKRRRRVKTKSS